MAPKKKPEFDDEALREHKVIGTWKDKGFDDMTLLGLSDKFLAAYRKDKTAKDKAAAKIAKRAKLPIPEPLPEMKNPKIDEPTFVKLLKTFKITVPDTKQLFKAANTTRTGLISFAEFVTVVGAIKNKEAPSDDKLGLVFRMYDRDRSGQLESGEVQLLLDTGLSTMGGAGETPTQVERDEHLDAVMNEMTSSGGETKPWWWRRGVTEEQLRSSLDNSRVVKAITPSAAAAEVPAKVSEDQLFEATVMAVKPASLGSRMCVIL